MPAKRKAAAAKRETVKEPEPVTRRSTRGTSAVADKSATGTKRKASPSPTPAPKKVASAKRGRTRSPSPAPNNRPSRGRATVAKKEETKPEAKTPSRSASNQKGRVTRNVVQEAEEKKSTEKSRSSSRGAKTPVLPKEPVTSKQKAETPKARATSARGRSATPKENKITPSQVTVTPKQKSATPKQKPTPKQKQQTPKMQKSLPSTKKATPKSTPKKQTKPDPPPRSSRSRRSKDIKATDEESEENDKEQTEEESPVPNVATEGEDMEVATENTEKEDNMDADKDAEVEDKADNEEKEDDKTEEQEDKAESMLVMSKTGEADKLEDMSEETEIEKQTEKAEEEPALTEDADDEQKVEGDDDDMEDPKEEDEGVSEKAEDSKKVEDMVEEDEPEEEQDHEVENKVAESSEKKDNDVEEDEESAEDESEKGDEPVTVVEEVIEIDKDEESEQIDSDEKEGKSAEVEESNEIEESKVENTKPAEDSSVPEQSDAKVVEKNEVTTEETSIELGENDSNDGVEVISESSEKPEQDVIDLNDDSGDAVIIEEELAVDLTTVDDVEKGNGDQEQSKSVASVEEISDDDIEEIDTKQNNVHGNGTDGDDIEVIEFVKQVDKYIENVPTKRKFGDVESEEIDDSSPVKKVRMSTEEEIQENGAGSQEDVAEDYVVIEMSDVPQATSTEVQGSLPNPIFNRSFIPNPTFSGSPDSSKQFSVVTYNVLADCHLFRNDYTFTEAKYLEPDYRLKKIIEEVRYLDGDVVCMQEVDPQFFQQQLLPSMRTAGYEGVHKQRANDYYNEGEATFYRNSRFELVDSKSSTLQHLLKKELVDGIEPAVQDAVEKYMSLPDVVIVTKLKCKNTGSEVTVGNVHIQWGEMKVPDAQCVQIASAVKEIVSMATGDNFPHIICGDFNSPPLSSGYLVARDGYPSGDDTINTLMKIEGLQLPDGKKASLVNSLWPAFQHTSSALRSAYSEAQGYEPEVSSYNCVMCDCVDYIFYSSTSLENVGVLQTASKEKIMETGGIPNCYFPSDHISLKSVLSFK